MEIWSSKNVGLRILVQQKCWSENILVQLQLLGPSGFMTQVSINLLVHHHKA